MSDSSRAKRRKVRKGTFSCWECKKRKIRCQRETASSPVCISCQTRELSCISQEFEQGEDEGYEDVNNRLVQVETLFNRLVNQNARNFTTTSNQPRPPGIDYRVRDSQSSWPLSPRQDWSRGQESLIAYLQSVIPQPAIATLILSRNRSFNRGFKMLHRSSEMTRSFETVVREPAPACGAPPRADPALFARQLIQLALCLQQLEASDLNPSYLQLKEPFNQVAHRYFDVASRHVTSQDLLINSADGLEALLLEGTYHITTGNLRLAWLTFRRALSIAQLMGGPWTADKKDRRAQFVWFRLVYSDRFLSLMLGLPYNVSDNTFASNETLDKVPPGEKLERIHVMIAGRIISRNIGIQRRGASGDGHNCGYTDDAETQDIDHELKKACRVLPTKWWMPPTLTDVTTDAEGTEKTTRLMAQMHHYYLIVLLHQPYIIPGVDHQPWGGDTNVLFPAIGDYSKVVILSAAREVLSRFLILRDYHCGPSYRVLDDKAFIASVAVLLVHLDGHRLGPANTFEHQRSQDLAIIDTAIDRIENSTRLNKDTTSNTNARKLRKLVEIESDAADGVMYILRNKRSNKEPDVSNIDEYNLQISIAYFGTISVERQAPNRPLLGPADPEELLITPEMVTQTTEDSGGQINPNDLYNQIPISEFSIRNPIARHTHAELDHLLPSAESPSRLFDEIFTGAPVLDNATVSRKRPCHELNMLSFEPCLDDADESIGD